MGLHCEEGFPQEKKGHPPKKKSRQNSRVLLKTIPNKNEMKNKYKTKLKKYALPDTSCFLADNSYLCKLSADYLLYANQVLRFLGAEAS